MSWPWKLRRAIEPRRAVSIRAMELETAKEILAEVFGARPGEVEEMIKRRLLGRANYDCDKAFQSLFLWNSPSEHHPTANETKVFYKLIPIIRYFNSSTKD